MDQHPKSRAAGTRSTKDVIVPLELKADVDRRELIAYASVFDVLDRQGDIVVPGAFKNTIKEDGDRVKVLYQHDTSRLIGKPTHMEEDTKGLLTVSKISRVPDGDLVLQLAADGVLDRMSIGFEIIKASEFEDEELRSQLTGFAALFPMHKLEVLRLWEYSPVTFAANDSADVIAVRSMGGGWIPLYSERAWPHTHPSSCGGESETPALDQLLGPAKAQEIITHASMVTPMVAAIDVGSFVSWGDRIGKVLSIAEDIATIQVYDGATPTSDTADVRMAELTEIDPPEAEPVPDESANDPDAETTHPGVCDACGKSTPVLDNSESPADTFEEEAKLITQLRSFAALS
jgi:HK97 family phage prohead protease